jgi:hypothetical protein
VNTLEAKPAFAAGFWLGGICGALVAAAIVLAIMQA